MKGRKSKALTATRTQAIVCKVTPKATADSKTM